ncbi:hypothetical protein LTR08_005933 [Meristemomyces frigidus]|nr:hypothetical protein LTR08_005933 [Meristemomyces frigidus]
MPFTVGGATESEATAIAQVLTSNESSTFFRLQLGSVDLETLNNGMAERIVKAMQKPEQRWIVARDEGNGEVMSYAQWVLPKADDEVDADPTPDEERKTMDEFRKGLMPDMNVGLMVEFWAKLHVMRRSVLRGRRHYLLGNLGTLPAYQRRGAASALTSWPFAEADKEGVIVYLDTDEAGDARRMYEKLGFERVGDASFDLSKHGGQGRHTHMGMIRKPQEEPYGSST